MLLKHSAHYLLASGLPGLINFLALALYTRMLSPDEYGRYALMIAAVGLFNVVLFQWLRLSLLRFMPAHLDNPRPLLSALLSAFVVLALFTGCLGLLLACLWPDPIWRGLIMLSVPLIWAQAWFELNLELSRSRLKTLRYGLMSGVKAVVALALGATMVLFGLGAYGPLIGLLIGMLLAAFLWGRVEWNGLSLQISNPILSDMLSYGLPLSATFALAFVVSSSDRFLIAWLLGEGPAGIYSASYDLSQQTLILLMTVVNLAAYPLAIRALEQRGVEAAQEQLRQNAILLMAIAFPATVGMAVLAPNISTVILGVRFHEDATLILPWVALAVLLSGLRAYYFDLAFQFGRHTLGQVWVIGAAAILNIVLNLWWIPEFGLIGAAYAMFAAYLLALILSATLGQRVFAIPIPYLDGFKVALASLLMGFMLSLSPDYQGFYALAAKILLGSMVYLILLGLLNVYGCGTRLLRSLIG